MQSCKFVMILYTVFDVLSYGMNTCRCKFFVKPFNCIREVVELYGVRRKCSIRQCSTFSDAYEHVVMYG